MKMVIKFIKSDEMIGNFSGKVNYDECVYKSQAINLKRKYFPFYFLWGKIYTIKISPSSSSLCG